MDIMVYLSYSSYIFPEMQESLFLSSILLKLHGCDMYSYGPWYHFDIRPIKLIGCGLQIYSYIIKVSMGNVR